MNRIKATFNFCFPNSGCRRQLWTFWILLAVALGLRMSAAVVIDQRVTAEGRQFLIEGDANGYWELGQKIAAGEEYSIYQPPRRILRTPGFPLLLAACIQVFGPSIFAASIVMAFVGCGCCWLTWILAKRVTDEDTALWAMAFVAVSPLQIGSSVQILSETWFTFWLLLCLIALTPLLTKPATMRPWWPAFLSGLLTGLTVLVRPGWILWTGASGILVLLFGRNSTRSRLASSDIHRRWLLSSLFCHGPSETINATGHLVFTSLWSGPSLYDGLHPGATGASDMTFVDREDLFSKMSEFDVNAIYKQRAFEFAIQNPRRAIELACLKAGRYLSPSLNAAGFSGGPFSLFCLLWYSVFTGLLILGCFHLRKDAGILLMLSGPFLQFLLVHMVFVGSIRYRLPVEFPLSIIAANGLVALFRRATRKTPNVPTKGEPSR